jgi:hypothetical protein
MRLGVTRQPRICRERAKEYRQSPLGPARARTNLKLGGASSRALLANCTSRRRPLDRRSRRWSSPTREEWIRLKTSAYSIDRAQYPARLAKEVLRCFGTSSF